ncbi:hypothetical protein KV134_10590 [Tetragenococcus halophilus]|uniref:Uncharacterized protein n=1 Tax=Tetragenococcus halophilus (strain DSM 20338 / JCM 20259 / NCIMB 9735 / NBRC 12172) TaxID=945021 RepID=A0AAN1SI75_TETHN|nr:hypothetical protein [Tetragenococcus halophilus]NWO00566.1 hypothetical protein [Tetragenococcus halophilus]QXN86587.1 hypothetical protein KV134_10590 [Tetragenococcus halophilus]RQD29522.1 hypothetical protein C7K42_11725 [Tetragenococcus halophilus subsp. halophilus DSM 20339]WJS81654.1 hypothetical protein KFZ55_10395 [Tetragenococcus halophilus]BAK95490.1 hypothetical protein TEH_21630 [Tetragenococcus halophilus NBRC 12172]
MIITLLSIMAIILVAMGVILCIKQTIFFSLITKNSQNKTFLSTFGVIFIFLGMICLLVGFFNQLEWAIAFLCFMLVISGIFSFLLAKKMS